MESSWLLYSTLDYSQRPNATKILKSIAPRIKTENAIIDHPELRNMTLALMTVVQPKVLEIETLHYIELMDSRVALFINQANAAWFKSIPRTGRESKMFDPQFMEKVDISNIMQPCAPLMPIPTFARDRQTNQLYLTLPHLIMDSRIITG